MPDSVHERAKMLADWKTEEEHDNILPSYDSGTKSAKKRRSGSFGGNYPTYPNKYSLGLCIYKVCVCTVSIFINHVCSLLQTSLIKLLNFIK